jgi:hypothetical protein
MPGNASLELRSIAGRLRAAGDKGNLNALRKGLRAGAGPLIPAVRQAAIAKLPKTGGLNQQVAGQQVKVSVRMSARTADVRLTTTAPDTAMTDSGFVRHPTYGNRSRWITQQIPDAAGWWSDTLARKSVEVTPVLLAELERVAAP